MAQVGFAREVQEEVVSLSAAKEMSSRKGAEEARTRIKVASPV